MKRFCWLFVFAAAVLSSCSKPASGPHATVVLRDGSSVSGMVLSSSPAKLEIAGDDKVTRSIPTDQVQSVNYDAAPATAATPATAAAPAPATAPAEPAAAPPSAPAQPAPAPASAPAITTKSYRVPAGKEISVRTNETIDSSRAAEGQTFGAEITRNVLDRHGNVVIPRGADARIVVKSASRGGHFHGASDLVLDLSSVSIAGRRYRVNSAAVVERGKDGIGANKRTAKFAGSGAVVGAIIGAIAGGGKGAAIGAGAGAGAGTVGEIATKGASVKVPVESVLTFRLESPLEVVAEQ
jgi:YMGG-like Gly-zipper